MSYDIDLIAPECPTCHRRGDTPDFPNPTYNLAPIFHRVLEGGIRGLNGRKASETIAALRAAHEHIHAPGKHDELRALEPDNGWGSLKGAREAIDQMLAAAIGNPDSVWRIS